MPVPLKSPQILSHVLPQQLGNKTSDPAQQRLISPERVAINTKITGYTVVSLIMIKFRYVDIIG